MITQLIGKNWIFRLATDHSAVVNKTTGAAITTPAIGDAAYILQSDPSLYLGTESTDLSYADTGIPTLKIVHTDSTNDYLDFIKIAAPRSAEESVAQLEEFTCETGAKFGGASASSGIPYLCIHPVGLVGDNLLTQVIIGTLSKADTINQSSGKFVRRTLTINGTACKADNLVIPQAYFASSIFNGTIDAAMRTISKGYYHIEYGLPKA